MTNYTWLDEILAEYPTWCSCGQKECAKSTNFIEAKQAIIDHLNAPDRFEVIDETGRAYVKGSIYGSPVKIELSYQDDGRTLKVFVEEKTNVNG